MDHGFSIVSEKLVYKRYLAVFDRQVRFPDGRVVDYDVIGSAFNQEPHFVVIVPFNKQNRTVTVIQEYCQGLNEMMYNFPCGGHRFSVKKHGTTLQAARQELNEEAALVGGEWIPLLPEGHKGVPEVKWCINRFTPYLCIDPVPDPNPPPQDAEEHIIVEKDVSMARVKQLICEGRFLMHSVQTFMMATQALEQRGLL